MLKLMNLLEFNSNEVIPWSWPASDDRGKQQFKLASNWSLQLLVSAVGGVQVCTN